VGITEGSLGTVNTSPYVPLPKAAQRDPGNKDDLGKLRWDLLPVGPMKQVVEVYTMGVKKYGDRNWERGLTWGRVFAAMMRHAWAWWGGEERDMENGQHHLASVVWTALALMEYEETHRELDNRPTSKCLSSPDLPRGYRSWKDLERACTFEREAERTDPYRKDLKVLRQCDNQGYQEERT
jgi:hypothetical protein